MGMDVTIIKVEGMMCNRCKAHVEKAVLKTEGVEYCEVSLENKNVTVKVKDNKVIVNESNREGIFAVACIIR